ncbi:MAG TPA: SDR family oxidoreductase [Jatrophihabitans sp.]|jgi:3-oxoacyl-[acyl-carrier protein] reductase|uniref:SDR family oxidoreductase n=1 Tax=Jatrophihabitans sp. TaxID=1932789 RepID=UPI002F1D752F
MYGLAGKRALVLCGTRGIGLGVARCLAGYGSSVTISGASEASAAETVRNLPGAGNSWFACDFAKPGEVGDRVADTGPYDIILLNSPGSAPSTVDQLSATALQQSIDLMLLSIQSAVTAGLPAMRRNGWGRLIAITSTSLSAPISGLAASSVARSAVQSYLKLLAESVGRFGITVNHVIPGKIDTDRLRAVEAATAERLGADVDSLKAATLDTIPLGRYGTPEDIGELVSFLASDQAAYITGTGIRCDGGLTRSI